MFRLAKAALSRETFPMVDVAQIVPGVIMFEVGETEVCNLRSAYELIRQEQVRLGVPDAEDPPIDAILRIGLTYLVASLAIHGCNHSLLAPFRGEFASPKTDADEE
jgi:hypothetical protein